MKKQILFACVAVIVAVTTTSCFSRGNQATGTEAETAEVAEVPSAAPAVFTATATGVGPIQYNMPAADVPPAYEGLYDAVEPYTETLNIEGEDYTYNRLRFTLGGTPAASATDYDGKLGSVAIVAPNVTSPEGIGPGMPVAKLLEAGPNGWFDQDGSLYCKVGELMFKVTNALTESGWQKIDGGTALTTADFTAGARVESIVYF